MEDKEKIELLKRDNKELFERSKQHYLALREWEMPCAKVLENIKHIEKDKRGVIVICFNEHSVGEFDIANPLYPLIEKLLKEYEKKAEFERLLKKAVKCDFTPITPLTKGE
jgi:sulfur relay (sulfurtransferase) DsrC/TusE family protein